MRKQFAKVSSSIADTSWFNYYRIRPIMTKPVETQNKKKTKGKVGSQRNKMPYTGDINQPGNRPTKTTKCLTLPHPTPLLPGTGWWTTGVICPRKNRHRLQRLQTAHCPRLS